MSDDDTSWSSILGAIGRTCRLWIPALLSSAAFTGCMIFSFWCESIKFEALPVGDGRATDERADLHFGPWYQLKTTIEQTEVGGGNTLVTTNNECVEWSRSPDIDSKWKAVRAFTVLNAIMGGFATASLWFVPCVAGRIPAHTWQTTALCYAITYTLFQGLTFLIFQSNACTDNSVINAINVGSLMFYEDECDWDVGSTANVISVVCWFLTGVAMLVTGAPAAPERRPAETQTVTYQQEVAADGTRVVAETKVVKGTAIPAPEEQPAMEEEAAK